MCRSTQAVACSDPAAPFCQACLTSALPHCGTTRSAAATPAVITRKRRPHSSTSEETGFHSASATPAITSAANGSIAVT